MQVAEIELYEILKPRVGEKEAKALVEYIETKVEKKFEGKKDLFVTKEDLANAKAELEIKMEKIRTDIIKWMFIFWAGQIGALIAILEIFFRK
jgi:demethoxyubiquinone hydroxylase (CLK1/Coq7/Cat5 family)